jgi:hypothetical protein
MEEKNDSNIFYEQILPLILTIVIFMSLGFILYVYILLLNKYTSIDISMDLRITDVLVGFTIYLKTSVDFAIYIGNLMKKFPGWKNRIPIEIGTAFGNALGTLIVLTIWNFFREVDMVLAIMIFIASLVLLKLSEDGFEHAFASNRIKGFIYNISQLTYFTVQKINVFFSPIVGRILPNLSFDEDKANKNTLAALFMLSFSVPFILGLDDFAGYVPLFNVVNVFGFAIGVFAGHMVLNALLFMSPQKTIKAVSNPYISLAGGYVFIILALIGFREIIHILHLF